MIDHEIYKKIINISNKDISEYIPAENGTVYHYTSPTGFNGIITNHTLRFTDRNYLNDYSEGRYVLDLCLHSRFETILPKEYRTFYKGTCKKLYDNLSIKKRHVYQCSFSLDSDNLSLWNYYTKDEGIKGYNIGFQTNELGEKVITNRELSPGRRVKIFGSKVIYSVNLQKKIIKSIVKDFSNIIYENKTNKTFCFLAIELLVEKILHVGSFFKNDCFKMEKEFRLVMFLVSIWNEETKSIEFLCLDRGAATYEKNGLLIPYVDIEFKREALKEIVISPTLSFEEVSGNIRNALKLHAFNENKITITKSNIPVRY